MARIALSAAARTALAVLACCPNAPADVVAELTGAGHVVSTRQLLARLDDAGLVARRRVKLGRLLGHRPSTLWRLTQEGRARVSREGLAARADALAQNQDAVIGQQLAEQWPAIVEAAAKPFGGIDQLIVLNGAQGLSEVLAQALSQGVTGLRLARNLLSGQADGNGDAKVAAAASASEPPSTSQ